MEDDGVVADRSSAKTFYSLAGGTLYASTDGGRTFTTLQTVQSASALGFGKAAPDASYQALYLIGTVKDVTYGRVYVGTNGPGLQYGDPS
jgi:hypothetical protein